MPYHSSVISKHLCVIRHWKDGRVLLASSDLTGKYWDGSIVMLPHAECGICKPCEIMTTDPTQSTLATMDTESGIASAIAYGSGEAVIGLDSGAVYFLTTEGDPSLFNEAGSSCEHDDIVSTLAINADYSKVVSGSFDMSLKIWDLNTLASIATYRPAHCHLVWSVEASSIDKDIFISCGQDNQILLWDSRLPKPASLINKHPLKGIITALSWQPNSNSTVAIGDELGTVSILDIRHPVHSTPVSCHQRRIHDLEFSPLNNKLLATCADDTRVNVLNISKMEICYKNDQHEDFVRGLSWHPTKDALLYSCGWDCAIYPHSVEPTHNQL